MERKAKGKDPSSSANSRQVIVSHWDWEVIVDFKKKTLRCTATLQLRTLCEGVENLVRVVVFPQSGINVFPCKIQLLLVRRN